MHMMRGQQAITRSDGYLPQSTLIKSSRHGTIAVFSWRASVYPCVTSCRSEGSAGWPSFHERGYGFSGWRQSRPYFACYR